MVSFGLTVRFGQHAGGDGGLAYDFLRLVGVVTPESRPAQNSWPYLEQHTSRIIHTFLTAQFRKIAHRNQHAHLLTLSRFNGPFTAQ
jgi:hypothetical protein